MTGGRALLLLAAACATAGAGGFPQPVQVGQLIGRAVLQPIEAQTLLGRVHAVTRGPDGSTALIVARGGLFSFGTRLAAVPLAAAALLGEHVALITLSPAELAALPEVAAPADTLPPAATVQMGLVRPFH